MISILGLKKTYGDRVVLNINALTLEAGFRYAVIGANGSGKSTLLKILANIITQDEGLINKKPNIRIAYLPQKPFGFDISLLRNVTLAKNDKQKALSLIDELGLTPLIKKKGSKLSGGETQRMTLARTLMIEYDILILDEPTAAMDINSSTAADSVLAKRLPAHATLLFTTHSISEAERLADYVIYIEDGSIVEILAAKDFIKNAQCHKTKKFLQTR